MTQQKHTSAIQMLSLLDFLKMNFTEPLILSLPTEGLTLSWVIQVRGDVVILVLFHIQEGWAVLLLKRCLLSESPWLFHTHLGGSTNTPSILGAFSFWRCSQYAKPRDNYRCYLFLTHIPVLSCCCTILSEPMETEVCALGFSFSGQMVSAAVLWWPSPHCPLPLQLWMGMSLQHLSCFLPWLWLCCAASLSAAATPGLVLLCSREPQKISAPSHTHPGKPGLSWQPNTQNWFQQPVDVLVLQAQQGTTLHHEWHWQAENWV